MSLRPILNNVSDHVWQLVTKVLGESPVLTETKEDLHRTRYSLEEIKRTLEQQHEHEEEQVSKIARLERDLEQARNERLEWMAKESSTRKEVQDLKERNKELLDQVVQLTHRQREAKQSLLDQKFKTEATPLERNRFESEMSAARARVSAAEKRMQEAEQRAKKAEEKAARVRALEKKAQRVKELQTQLAWDEKKSRARRAALSAAIEKIRLLEERVARLSVKPGPKKKSARQTYRKPRIRLSRKASIEEAI